MTNSPWTIPDAPPFTVLRSLAESASDDEYRMLNGLRYKITAEELAVLSRAVERYAEQQVQLAMKKLRTKEKK